MVVDRFMTTFPAVCFTAFWMLCHLDFVNWPSSRKASLRISSAESTKTEILWSALINSFVAAKRDKAQHKWCACLNLHSFNGKRWTAWTCLPVFFFNKSVTVAVCQIMIFKQTARFHFISNLAATQMLLEKCKAHAFHHGRFVCSKYVCGGHTDAQLLC